MGKRPTFEEICEELTELQKRKGHDYGGDEDPLGNLVDAQEFGISPWVGTSLRANDKMARIKTFVRSSKLECEKVDDSLRDLAVYAIHALRLYRERISEVESSEQVERRAMIARLKSIRSGDNAAYDVERAKRLMDDNDVNWICNELLKVLESRDHE